MRINLNRFSLVQTTYFVFFPVVRIAVILKARAQLASRDSLVEPHLKGPSSSAAKPPGLMRGPGSHSSALSLTTVH